MIDFKQLRYGNIIGMNLAESPQNWFRVLEPAETSMKVTDSWNKVVPRQESDYYDAEDMEGIPISPEWLEMLGFEKRRFHERDEYVLRFEVSNQVHFLEASYPRNVAIDFILYIDKRFYKHVQFVHQLQNLFFALTGGELTIKK